MSILSLADLKQALDSGKLPQAESFNTEDEELSKIEPPFDRPTLSSEAQEVMSSALEKSISLWLMQKSPASEESPALASLKNEFRCLLKKRHDHFLGKEKQNPKIPVWQPPSETDAKPLGWKRKGNFHPSILRNNQPIERTPSLCRQDSPGSG